MNEGTTETTVGTVSDYLVDNFLDKDSTDLTKTKAQSLINKNWWDIMQDAINLRSFAYYPGDKIAEREGLLWKHEEGDQVDENV